MGKYHWIGRSLRGISKKSYKRRLHRKWRRDFKRYGEIVPFKGKGWAD